jgi:hypothetical protein
MVTICLASSSVTGFLELKKAQNKLILEQYREKAVWFGLVIETAILLNITFAHRSTCCLFMVLCAGMSILCAEVTTRRTPTLVWRTVAMSLWPARGPVLAKPTPAPVFQVIVTAWSI